MGKHEKNPMIALLEKKKVSSKCARQRIGTWRQAICELKAWKRDGANKFCANEAWRKKMRIKNWSTEYIQLSLARGYSQDTVYWLNNTKTNKQKEEMFSRKHAR